MNVICRQTPGISPAEETETLPRDEEIIVCAHCNQYITDPAQQITVNGSFSHIFANPHGHVFEIGCFSQADGCGKISAPSMEFSWFMGYAWQIGICRYCSTHVGWFFSSETDRFYGLILEKLIFP